MNMKNTKSKNNKKGEMKMTVSLCKVLEESPEWQQVREISEKAMKERGLDEYTVRIMAASPEQEGVLVFPDRSVNVCFVAEDKVMEIIVGRGDEQSPTDNLYDPEEFAMASVLDCLDQFVYPDAD